ncbi:MAG: hypothetical protein ACE5E5_12755 [Phycisphaerae bacterium]
MFKHATLATAAGLVTCVWGQTATLAEPYGGFTRCNTQTVAIDYGPRIERTVRRIQYVQPTYTQPVVVQSAPAVQYVPATTVRRTVVVQPAYAAPVYYDTYPVVYPRYVVSRRVYSDHGRRVYRSHGHRYRRHVGFSYHRSRRHHRHHSSGISIHVR